jgi:GH24 family phage-related lysozyme (muramidase)
MFMGTWMKETDVAIYLMQGGYWISRISKYPSQNNPKEKIVNISGLRSWFNRPDYPRAMTVAIGTGAPEPQPMPAQPPTPPPSPGESGKINDSGLEIIKHFEGLRTDAYPDPATGGEPWTIGYGHTSMAGPPNVYPGLSITAAEAEEILKRDLGVYEKAVSDAVTRTPTSDQFSAMVSLTFNIGGGNFRSSTVLREHNNGNFSAAANAFLMWNKAGNPLQEMAGLTRRRNAERMLYLSQDYHQYL